VLAVTSTGFVLHMANAQRDVLIDVQITDSPTWIDGRHGVCMARLRKPNVEALLCRVLEQRGGMDVECIRRCGRRRGKDILICFAEV
jgi:hypothetical protein